MKKLVSLLTVIVLVAVLATAVFAAEEPALVVDTVETVAGDEVVITVSIVNNPGIAMGEMVIKYDESVLEPVDMIPDDEEDEDTLGLQCMVVNEDWKWETIFNVKNGFFGFSASKGKLKGDCVMFTMTFKVKEGTLPGTYPVAVDVDFIGDDDQDYITSTEFCGGVVVACADHVAGETVTENVVAPSCATEGSHDEVTYCVYCDKELSRNTVVDAKLPHTPADAVVENEKAATCAAEGSYDLVVYCSECDAELSRETKTVEKLAHTPADAVVENEKAATCAAEGSYDLVVYCSECGVELSRETKTVEKLAHTPAEAVKENVVDADCVTAGSFDLVVYCAECGVELSREHVEGEFGDHVAGEAVVENEVAGADCVTKGSYDLVVYCTKCGHEISRETKEGEFGAHNYVEHVTEPTCCQDGMKAMVCEICVDIIDETVLPATGEHTVAYYDNEDGATHTVYCVTGDKVLNDAEAHTYGDYVDDAENAGWKYQECVYCGYIHREEIAETGDNAMIAVAMATASMMAIALVVSKKKEV